MAQTQISAENAFGYHTVEVLDSRMTYIDTGAHPDSAVVFLHGNPMSSYLWRNIIPHVAPTHRCVAPDLIGMGKSGKPNIEYRFVDHARYLSAFLDAVIPAGPVVLVVHDWGSALGFDWARQRPDRIIGLVLMEFVVPAPSWDGFPEAQKAMFQAFRAPETGRKMLIEENMFVEVIVPSGIVRALGDAEMDQIREPFTSPESREPIFQWPNEIPIAGSPPDVYKLTEELHTWLLGSELPKLLFWATPGALIPEKRAAWYSENLHNTQNVGVGPGIHWLQEDNPHLIGSSIAKWLPTLAAA